MTPIFAAVDYYILAFSAITVVVTIWMGFRSAKTSKTASDFFVAGRSVSVGWNASAISGEYLSAASFMGIAGMVMSSGYDALWYPVCYACGYLFLLLFIAGPLRRFGAYTIPDFAEGRYDSPLFRKIAVCFVLFIGFFYTMPQMKGAGTTLAYIFPGLPYWAGVVLVGAVITLNVALGGMKGITLVQAFQYWAKMFAISVPIFVLMAVYGHYGNNLHLNSTGRASDSRDKQMHFRPLNWGYDSINGNSNQIYIAYWLTKDRINKELTKGDWNYAETEQNVYGALASYSELTGRRLIYSTNIVLLIQANRQNFPIAQAFSKDVRIGQLVTGLASRGVALLDFAEFIAAVPKDDEAVVRKLYEARGPLAFSLLKSLPDKAPNDETWVNPFGPLTTKAAKAAKLSPEEAKPYSLLYTYSLIIALICGTAGLPHILVRFYTNPDGGAAKRTTMWVMILIGIFYVFPPVFGVMGRNLFPELYNGIGAKGTDKIVLELPRLLNEKYAPLGSILSGITCAGAFAAFMSTFSGLLVSMTGALAHDVYGRMLRPKSTPEQRMRMFKFAAVLIGFVSILLGSLVEPLEINFMVGQAFAIAAASYFPLLFMSVWWRGMTMRGAAVGMLTGGLCALVAATLTNVSNLALDKGPMGKIFSGFAGMNDFWAHHPLLRILCEQPAIWTVPLAITLMIVVSKATRKDVPSDVRMKMLVLHAPEKLGLKQEYIQEHQGGGH
ncbi:MAG: cation acetate symporter [Verrucomicrobiota bacterium]